MLMEFLQNGAINDNSKIVFQQAKKKYIDEPCIIKYNHYYKYNEVVGYVGIFWGAYLDNFYNVQDSAFAGNTQITDFVVLE